MQTERGAEAALADARQAAQVAGRFFDLQGLRQVVAGVGMLLFFGWLMVFPLSRDDLRAHGIGLTMWGLAVLLAGCAVLVVVVLRVNAWYRRHFGVVEQSKRQRNLGRLVGGGGVVAILIPFEIESLAMNVGQAVPVNLLCFGIGASLIAYWLYLGREFRHYLVFAAVGFVLSVVSIAGIPPANFIWHLREAILYLALITIAGGYIDHRVLMRSLSQTEGPLGLGS